MLALRQRQWDALVAAGEVPRFLQRWLQYAHSQPVGLYVPLIETCMLPGHAIILRLHTACGTAAMLSGHRISS